MTTPTYRPRYQVTPPAWIPRRYTLLAAAQIIDEPGELWQEGVEYYSDNCNVQTGYVDGWCPPLDSEGKPTEWDKDVSGYDPSLVTGDPFTITSGVACQSPVFPAADKAREALARGEDLQVEQRFWASQMKRTDLRILTARIAALDEAIALLEEDAARRYAGQLYLHVPPRALIYLKTARIIEQQGGLWRTPYGTIVVPAAGYVDQVGPSGRKPETGAFWMLATGAITVRRSAVFTGDAFDVKKNRRGAMAERTYVITADCYAAAIQVEPCGCTTTVGAD